MHVVAVIPARYASSRFPGKLLANDTGRSMLEHVYRQVTRCKRVDEVMIATDDDRIYTECQRFGAKVVMTRQDHTCGTDRIAEALMGYDVDLVINVQGDEPEILPTSIDKLVEIMVDDAGAQMGTLAACFGEGDDIDNRNVVKVVQSVSGRALYFSRSVVPFHRIDGDAPETPIYYRHIGLYAYRKAVLMALSKLAPTPLEQAERLEQLRALENDISIAIGLIDHGAEGIDTREQYKTFVERYNLCRKPEID